jgi:hypothetical protein
MVEALLENKIKKWNNVTQLTDETFWQSKGDVQKESIIIGSITNIARERENFVKARSQNISKSQS